MLKLRTFIIFSAFCSLVPLTRAQFDSQSPYSYYGIGTLVSNTLQNGFAMGGNGHALRDSCYLNPLNPASYASIDVTQLNFGFEGNLLNRLESGQKFTNSNVFINQFGLGTPIMHKHGLINWGMFLGYSPMAHVGYSLEDTNTTMIDTEAVFMTHKYTGTGGLNKVTWGNGLQFGKNFSVGFNINYLFGTSNRIRVLELPINQGYLSSRVEEKTTVNAFTFDAGFQTFFNFNIKKKGRVDSLRRYQLVLGGTYNYGSVIDANFSQLGIQYPATASGVDTFLLNPDSKGEIALPHGFGAGVLFSNTNIWKVGIDFNYTIWSGFKYFDQPTLQFNDSYSFHLGTEYSPRFAQKNDEKRSARFFKNIRYRAGVRYNSRFFRPDANLVDETAFSFGLGLPFGFTSWRDEDGKNMQVLSYVNFGIEGGIANSRNAGLVNETFFRFIVSLTLRDKWFIKLKYY